MKEVRVLLTTSLLLSLVLNLVLLFAPSSYASNLGQDRRAGSVMKSSLAEYQIGTTDIRQNTLPKTIGYANQQEPVTTKQVELRMVTVQFLTVKVVNFPGRDYALVVSSSGVRLNSTEGPNGKDHFVASESAQVNWEASFAYAKKYYRDRVAIEVQLFKAWLLQEVEEGTGKSKAYWTTRGFYLGDINPKTGNSPSTLWLELWVDLRTGKVESDATLEREYTPFYRTLHSRGTEVPSNGGKTWEDGASGTWEIRFNVIIEDYLEFIARQRTKYYDYYGKRVWYAQWRAVDEALEQSISYMEEQIANSQAALAGSLLEVTKIVLFAVASILVPEGTTLFWVFVVLEKADTMTGFTKTVVDLAETASDTAVMNKLLHALKFAQDLHKIWPVWNEKENQGGILSKYLGNDFINNFQKMLDDLWKMADSERFICQEHDPAKLLEEVRKELKVINFTYTKKMRTLLEQWRDAPPSEVTLKLPMESIEYSLKMVNAIDDWLTKDYGYLTELEKLLESSQVTFIVTSLFFEDWASDCLLAVVPFTFDYTYRSSAATVNVKTGETWTSPIYFHGGELLLKMGKGFEKIIGPNCKYELFDWLLHVDGSDTYWVVSNQYPADPTTVRVVFTRPFTLIARYKAHYLLMIESDPVGLDLSQLAKGGGWYDRDSWALVEVPNGLVRGGTMYNFTGWSGDASGNLPGAPSRRYAWIHMDGPKRAVAKYKTKYALTVGAVGLTALERVHATTNLYVAGLLVASGIDERHQFVSFYDPGTILKDLNIDTPVYPTEAGWRFVFTHWSDGVTSSNRSIPSITMNAPKTITAHFAPQCSICFTTWGLPNEVAVKYTVNGAPHATLAGTPHSEWLTLSSSISFDIDPKGPFYAGTPTSYKYQFLNWYKLTAPGPPPTLVRGPDTYVAGYDSNAPKYEVTVDVRPGSPVYVNDAHYGFGPQKLSFIVGTVNKVSVPTYVLVGLGVRIHIPSNFVTFSSPTKITFQEHYEYLLTVKTSGLLAHLGSTKVYVAGSATMDDYGVSTINDACKDGYRKWFDADSATGAINIDTPTGGLLFVSWILDQNAIGPTRPLSALTMNQPHLAMANYAPPPDFSLSSSPSSRTIVQYGSDTFLVRANSMFAFNAPISLTLSGLPSDARYEFNPKSIAPTRTAMLTITAGKTAGKFVLTITGESGGLTRSDLIVLTINPAPGFSILAIPTSVFCMLGCRTSCHVIVKSVSGFSSPVSLRVSGVPLGVNASFDQPILTPKPQGPASSMLWISASTLGKSMPGNYTITITATSAKLEQSLQVSLILTGDKKGSWEENLISTLVKYLPILVMLAILIAAISVAMLWIRRREFKRESVLKPTTLGPRPNIGLHSSGVRPLIQDCSPEIGCSHEDTKSTLIWTNLSASTNRFQGGICVGFCRLLSLNVGQ